MRPISPDARLNSTSAGIVATRGSKDVNAQLMFFCTIYTNYNYKLLAGVKKLAIPWDKFQSLVWRVNPKVSQKERDGEGKVLVCICFGTKELVLMMIMISGIYL